MKHQQPKLSCGVDTINNRLVKSRCVELATPMEIIIGKSIEDCIVPLAFKIARIIPLYKKGAVNEYGNYRPVSLLPLLVWELICHVATYGCEVVVESVCYLFLVRDAPAIYIEFLRNSEFNLLSVHYFVQNRPYFPSIIA